jgi:hypothetical protein
MDAEAKGDLVGGEHSGRAESFVSALETVGTANDGDHAATKWFPPA